MENFIYFSRYIYLVKGKIVFFLTVFTRVFRVLFSRRKSIQLIHLDFAPRYHFTSSYLIIRYQFRNALWFHFKGLKKTTDNEIVIFNLKRIPTSPIELVVHGLFQRKTFILNATPEITLFNAPFKTAITQIGDINARSKQLEILNNTSVITDEKPIIVNKKIKLTLSTIKIKYPSFNQTDYL